MARRLPPLFSLAAAVVAAGVGGVTAAQDRPGMYLDPRLLPPDTRPGECVTRQVTGPGGAYRWERIECDAPVGSQAGWNDFDRWGHGRQPLQVQDGPLHGDRYGGWSQAYAQDYDGQGPDGRYSVAYPVYRVAGRDADGYLVWPGKRP